MSTDAVGFGLYGFPYLAPQAVAMPPGVAGMFPPPPYYADPYRGLAWGSVPPGMNRWAAPAPIAGAGPVGLGMFSAPGPIPQPDPNLEAQAVNTFLQDVTSSAIRKLFDYLSKNSDRPQLGNGVGLLNQAVDAFKARDFGRAFAQVYDVYRYITAARASAPDLPALA